MAIPLHRIVLISPDGDEHEVTDRMASDDLGTISEEMERDLLELVHGDYTLTLDNSDGYFDGIFSGLSIDTNWALRVERERDWRREKWELIFGGILDLPWSIQYDRKDKTIELQVFSYSKVLSRASAETQKRTVAGVTGSVSAGTKAVILSSTTNILRGDKITLSSVAGTSVTSETQTVDTVTSATALTTVSSWVNTFSSAGLVLETPYYRRTDPLTLAQALFIQAGISDYSISLSPTLSSYPTATSGKGDGVVGTVRSLVVQTTAAVPYIMCGTSTARYQTTGPRTAFTFSAANTTAQGEWTPYLATEPGTIQTRASVIDNGSTAWNHTAGDYYYLETSVVSGGTSSVVLKNKAGAALMTVDAYSDTFGDGFNWSYVEYLPVSNEIWCSSEQADGTQRGRYYRVAGGANSTISARGQFRYSVATDCLYALDGTTLQEWDPTSRGLLRSVDLSTALENQEDGKLWSLRIDGDHLFFSAITYSSGTQLSLVVVDLPSFSLLNSAVVFDSGISTFTTNVVLCKFVDQVRGENVYILNAGTSAWAVIGRSHAGVIDYADFEGSSCGQALKDIALATGATTWVENEKTGYFRSRFHALNAEPIEIETVPLEWESSPLSDFYRSAITVSGTSESGRQFSATAGITPDSEHSQDYSSTFISTETQAASLAQLYASGYSEFRRQDRVTLAGESNFLRPLQLVRFDGLDFIVSAVETDLSAGEQDVTLLETV